MAKERKSNQRVLNNQLIGHHVVNRFGNQRVLNCWPDSNIFYDREYKDKGVLFQTLVPCFVATRRISNHVLLPNFLMPSADDYAEDALSTIGYSTRTSAYWIHDIINWFSSLIRHFIRFPISCYVLNKVNSDLD
ncbi:Inactive hydroxysteroid dehydrogenase-like protein 1 [Dinothrombium tinctorium]|uniref:Inactive hydroxysteroid dehydrogenase-like protein 1 n=1 Tax=Dinothrombium tinctorium TaxID=1965070 RepID=A0A3S4QXY8_9ACAR|nr:Inactive hydroxysteroid dehydrogenase-like protein 1 [Dinothrombium tinctorium]